MPDLVPIPGIGELSLSVPPSVLGFRVLVVDDQPDWVETTEQTLRSRGLDEIDIAHSLADADRLVTEKDYDAVLFDIEMEEARATGKKPRQGDEWFLSWAKNKPVGFAAAITGHRTQIANPAELRAAGAAIVDKGDDAEFEVYDKLVTQAEKKREAVLVELGERVAAVLRDNPDVFTEPLTRPREEEIAVMRGVKGLVLEWLGTREDQTSPNIWVGTDNLSIADVTQQIQEGTTAGNIILENFLEHLRRLMGLKRHGGT